MKILGEPINVAGRAAVLKVATYATGIALILSLLGAPFGIALILWAGGRRLCCLPGRNARPV